ncbi:peptidoglycan-binding protein [Peribacillus butanolivorans]
MRCKYLYIRFFSSFILGKTKKAVIAFQKKHNLQEEGILGKTCGISYLLL